MAQKAVSFKFSNQMTNILFLFLVLMSSRVGRCGHGKGRPQKAFLQNHSLWVCNSRSSLIFHLGKKRPCTVLSVCVAGQERSWHDMSWIMSGGLAMVTVGPRKPFSKITACWSAITGQAWLHIWAYRDHVQYLVSESQGKGDLGQDMCWVKLALHIDHYCQQHEQSQLLWINIHKHQE